jgi:hypothetical protein
MPQPELVQPQQATAVDVLKKLFNPGHFVWMSFFFSFYPAGIMYAVNWGRLGDPKKRNILLAAYTAGFAAFITLAIIIPWKWTTYVFEGVNVALGLYMMRDQADRFKAHIQGGGKKASIILPVTVCIVLTAALVWMMITAAKIPEKSVAVNKCNVYYTETETKEDAQKLGSYLQENGIFTDANAIDVKLDNTKGSRVIYMVVDRKLLKPADFATLSQLGDDISKKVFNDEKVVFVPADEYFNEIKP